MNEKRAETPRKGCPVGLTAHRPKRQVTRKGERHDTSRDQAID